MVSPRAAVYNARTRREVQSPAARQFRPPYYPIVPETGVARLARRQADLDAASPMFAFRKQSMSFKELGLNDEIVRAVNEHGYTKPTPIQMQAIPAVLNGGDLMAGAQTGTGKTAGFVLPLLQRLAAARRAGKPVIRALILTPTRELAA